MSSRHAPIPIQMLTEKAWQRQLVDLARQLGWTVYHTYDSRRSQPGFPDLVLVRDRVLYVELKREQGKLTDAQAGWLDKLIAAGAEAYCWRPRDLEEAGMTLARRETRAA
jgi:hypothetical protein